MDIVPDDMPHRDLHEEVNSRTHKAGYTTREGRQFPHNTSVAGNFGERKRLKVWPRDKNGNLIQ